MLREAGCVVHSIARKTFDHGGTRNLGLEISGSSEFVLFMTQDALPEGDNVLSNLLAPFSDPKVGLVYGRQLPRDGARGIEAHARHFNYPDQSVRRSMPEASSLGIKAIFNSNSFAAYRRSALMEIGGFPSQVIMGEDQVVAAQLLLAGWSIHYAADACVKHSHNYKLKQEFARYFDIGVFHKEADTILEPFRHAGSEGFRYVKAEMQFLWKTAPARIPESLLRVAAKLIGYKLGSWCNYLPRSTRRALAWNKQYFLS